MWQPSIKRAGGNLPMYMKYTLHTLYTLYTQLYQNDNRRAGDGQAWLDCLAFLFEGALLYTEDEWPRLGWVGGVGPVNIGLGV